MSVTGHRRAIRTARRDDQVQAVADAWLRVPHHERLALQDRYADLHGAVSRLSAYQVATRHEPKEQHMNRIAPYWKAVVGFVAPGAVIITAATLQGSAGHDVITQAEWITAACACVITAGGVYAKSNR